MSIFDIVVASQLVAYWEELERDKPPYNMTEELFPVRQKLGLKNEWLKGKKGTPKLLKLSAFDVKAIPRTRQGFETISQNMPFFKESKYIDEELRQQLNMVIESGNSAIIDAIVMQIFDDEIELIEGAYAQRELMRMQVLTAGIVTIANNGQAYTLDYEIPENHKVNAKKSWSNPTADILEDIRALQNQIADDTGVKPTRAMCDRRTWGQILQNEILKKQIYVLSQGQANISDQRLREYLLSELGLVVVINEARFTAPDDAQIAFMPESTFVIFPDMPLGETVMGTTPEESDLRAYSAANVAITGGGIAVTTMKNEDPVTVETKVSMICCPTCPHIDKIGIISTFEA